MKKKLELASKSKNPVADRIHQELRDDIAAGRFMPGERLTSQGIASLKRVSRTPAREALSQLKWDGVVEIQHNCGATARKMDWQEVDDTYQLRELLEGFSVYKLASRGAPGEVLKQLETAAKARREARTLSDVQLAEYQFHRTILCASGVPTVSRIMEGSLALLSAFRLTRGYISLPNFDHGVDVNAEHDAIINAIRGGQAKLAAGLLKRHIRNARHRLMKAFGKSISR